MANDWGRPFTPEELEKLAKPAPGEELHYTGPNLAFQVPPTKPTPHDNPTCYAWYPESGCGIIFSDRDALNEALEAEPRLVEMTKEEYDKATKVNASERTAPVETYSEADGPWYVVYFGPVLYTVLAGPYDTQDDAAARLDIVWGQFEHDAAYDFTFPVRERSGLRAATVRTVYNLKGAYGKQ